MNQEYIKAIEHRFFRHFRRLDESAPNSEQESNFRWHALEWLVGDREPELSEAVEIGDAVTMLVVIDGAVHLIHTNEREAVSQWLGSLDGGTYVERLFVGEDNDYKLEGTFTHDKLDTPLTIRAHRWAQFKDFDPIRDFFRRCASGSVESSTSTT